MKLYFGSAVTTAVTLMIAGLLGFIGCTVWNRAAIQYWGRRSAFLLIFGLVVCCFGAVLILLAAIAAPLAKTQHTRQIWFYVMSGGALLKILTMEISRILL